MITKKDLEEMPFFKPVYGPAEAPANIAWDLFWAEPCYECDISGLDGTQYQIPDGAGYLEPQVYTEEDMGDHDDTDAALAALNDGFTLVKVPYAVEDYPESGFYRLLVCHRVEDKNPRLEREPTKPNWKESSGPETGNYRVPSSTETISIRLKMSQEQYELRGQQLSRTPDDVAEVDDNLLRQAMKIRWALAKIGLRDTVVILSVRGGKQLYDLAGAEGDDESYLDADEEPT
jgi:hypothetical protein